MRVLCWEMPVVGLQEVALLLPPAEPLEIIRQVFTGLPFFFCKERSARLL